MPRVLRLGVNTPIDRHWGEKLPGVKRAIGMKDLNMCLVKVTTRLYVTLNLDLVYI